MSILDRIGKYFGGNEPKTISGSSFKFLNDYFNSFSNWNGQMYENDCVRSAIDAIARNSAKLKARHIKIGRAHV